jgi:hypothetical protein
VAGDMKQSVRTLIGHLHADVFEMDRVAEIFGGALELRLDRRDPGWE